jgi:hypothetical protein
MFEWAPDLDLRSRLAHVIVPPAATCHQPGYVLVVTNWRLAASHRQRRPGFGCSATPRNAPFIIVVDVWLSAEVDQR